jgi:putative membrane protein
MRSTPLFRGLSRAALPAACALAVIAACKTSTGSGGAAASGPDGGAAAQASAAAMAGSDGGSLARDIGEGAGTAAGTVAQGVESAGRGIADAGAAAAGAVSGAAVTAADAAREAAAGARSGAAAALDGGTPPAEAGGGTATPSGAALTDAQIAAIAVAANKVDIEAAQAAKKKTKNAQVKKFASDMIRDHTSANKQAAALVKKLGVTPEESDASRSLAQGGKDNLDHLRPLKGKAFDRAYAEHEVTYHQQVLGALDDKLIPEARNAELKSLLESVRAVVAQHLDHAAALMDSLSK